MNTGANTAFNNYYYGEDTNIYTAAGIGPFFGGISLGVGQVVTREVNLLLKNPTLVIPAFGPIPTTIAYRNIE